MIHFSKPFLKNQALKFLSFEISIACILSHSVMFHPLRPRGL